MIDYYELSLSRVSSRRRAMMDGHRTGRNVRASGSRILIQPTASCTQQELDDDDGLRRTTRAVPEYKHQEAQLQD